MKNQQTTLKQWLVNTPIFFAITSFLLAVVVSVLAGLLLPKNETTLNIIGISMFVTTIIAAVFAIRRVQTTKMDRTGIVTIFNLKMLILTLMSLISLITTLNLRPIQMWLLSTTQTSTGIIGGFILVVCLTLISLYVLGVMIMGLWACFLRARTMNIPLWKIICSIPFGFDMIWLPGYFIPNKADKDPIITTQTKWISKLTNWTLSSPTNAGLLFTTLVITTGLFNGFSATLLTISMLLMFAIWLMQLGYKKFEKNIGNAYATTAVTINIAIIIYLIIAVFLF